MWRELAHSLLAARDSARAAAALDSAEASAAAASRGTPPEGRR